MIPTSPEQTIGWLLQHVADIVDLPPAMYAAAEEQYQLIGQFLADHDGGGWDVYPQGSIRLGTVVRPMTGDAGFDLDMVCLRDIQKSSTSQADLKQKVGDALEEYLKENASLLGAPDSCEPSRRCWTLHYADEFHMDVLPAIPDPKGSDTGILLTDKELTRWLRSDPIAYANWFRGQMAKQLEESRAAMAVKLSKSIEDIPEWQAKTTLQQLVQVLKVHRDIHFVDDLDDRPPSVLITTLAAQAYNGDSDLFGAIQHAVTHMGDYITDIDAGPCVMSPVADENFADKWAEYPQREEKFRVWLDKVEVDLQETAGLRGMEVVASRLGQSFGETEVKKAFEQLGLETRELRESGKLAAVGATAALAPAAAGAKPIAKHQFYGSSTP